MSQHLESLLGAERRAECARNDEALREQSQPPLPTHAQVTDAWHRRNDAQALELQLVDFRARGWM